MQAHKDYLSGFGEEQLLKTTLTESELADAYIGLAQSISDSQRGISQGVECPATPAKSEDGGGN